MNKTPKENKAIEKRIMYEIVVDSYNEEERAMSWYCYLEDNMKFPFKAKCVAKRIISPLITGEIVEVTGMAPEDECEKEMFVEIRWKEDALAVPLSQLEVIKVDKNTKQAMGDWHYWVNMGYEF